MWRSEEAIDRYALVHMASVAGDTLVAVALADSVFFHFGPGEARTHVALYLGLTMAPLALAAPMLVPLLDKGGFRRAISFGSAIGRMVAAIYVAPRFHTFVLFPAAFVLLVLSRIHGVTKNGLTAAYAGREDGLVNANARMGRLAVVAALLASIPGIIALKAGGKTGGDAATLYLAALAYLTTAFLTVRLPRPAPEPPRGPVEKTGRMAALATPAAATAGLRAASGFLLVLMAFALGKAHAHRYWFGLLAASATAGSFLGDVIGPRLSKRLRENVAVLGPLFAAGLAAMVAFGSFHLVQLVAFAAIAGAAAEFSRLGFQSLMQRLAPGGAAGKVFVRYEVVFQLAWVAGAFIPAVLPMSFRTGVLLMGLFYIVFGLSFLIKPRIEKRRATAEAEREAAKAGAELEPEPEGGRGREQEREDR